MISVCVGGKKHQHEIGRHEGEREPDGPVEKPPHADIPGLRRNVKWLFKPTAENGSKVNPGDIVGEVQESSLMLHKIMVPPNAKGGTVEGLTEGEGPTDGGDGDGGDMGEGGDVELTPPPTILEGDPSLDTHPTAAD